MMPTKKYHIKFIRGYDINAESKEAAKEQALDFLEEEIQDMDIESLFGVTVEES